MRVDTAPLDQLGYELHRGALGMECILELQREFERLLDTEGALKRTHKTFAVRHVLKASACVRQLASSEALISRTCSIFGQRAQPIKATFFDKVAQANWKVPWHQDMTISVKEKTEAPGFGPWSRKNNVHHVRAPAEILDRMLALRIHLDDCPADNGALKVLPATHNRGVLSAMQIAAVRSSIQPQTIEARSGDVLAMRPLLLHSSSPACSPRHRRVLHIEYCATSLPCGLRWYEW